MEKDYIVYECKVCGLVFALHKDSLRKAEVLGRYLACNLGHRPIQEINKYDNIKECMDSHNTYKRINGRVHQIK